jgi:hypothetical protein
MKAICPEEVRSLYKDGRIIPFLGAGASMAVSWKKAGKEVRGPSWRELVDQATQIIGAEEPELLRMRGSDLQILEYLKIKKDTLQHLTNWLHKRMDPDDADLKNSKLHNALSNLSLCDMIYTTNYDNFIERSLSLNNVANVAICSEHDLSQRLKGKRQVVKFHGDFNYPEKMVLSESDYYKRMNLEDAMDFKLRSDILGKAALFIGYSFNDQNVTYLFKKINELHGSLPHSYVGKRAYIIYSNPSDFEKQLFQARGVGVIPINSRSREEDISSILNQMADA